MNAPLVRTDDLSSPLLTVADILRLKADYEADARLLEELPARIKAKRRKYEASLFFAPPGFDADALVVVEPVTVESGVFALFPSTNSSDTIATNVEFPEPPAEVQEDTPPDESADGRITWAGELRRLLENESSGVSHQDVLERLKQTCLGQRVSKGEKGFYNAVAFLEKKGALIKNGGLLYSPILVERMKQRGELLPEMSIETRRRAGGSAALAIEVFRMFPSGLDANAVRTEMAKLPGVSASVVKHGHYIYNVLGTLMGQGLIEKDAQGIYKLREGVK